MSERFRVGKKTIEKKTTPATPETRPGAWQIVRVKTETGFTVQRVATSRARDRFWVSLPPLHFSGAVEEKLSDQSEGAGASRLVADFPGKVRKIVCKPGVVEAGADLVLVEAMKMEFAIKAPTSGRVVRVLVTEGQQIQPGDKFVEFEPTGR